MCQNRQYQNSTIDIKTHRKSISILPAATLFLWRQIQLQRPGPGGDEIGHDEAQSVTKRWRLPTLQRRASRHCSIAGTTGSVNLCVCSWPGRRVPHARKLATTTEGADGAGRGGKRRETRAGSKQNVAVLLHHVNCLRDADYTTFVTNGAICNSTAVCTLGPPLSFFVQLFPVPSPGVNPQFIEGQR